MKMTKRMKRALLWGLVGFTASFFLWQGVEESFFTFEVVAQEAKMLIPAPNAINFVNLFFSIVLI